MYLSGLIDTTLWDKAELTETVYGFSDNEFPFLGLLFQDSNTGREIFSRWKKYLGDEDTHDLIRISIIEGDVEGEPEGYTIFIGSNPEALISQAQIRGHEIDKHILIVSRFHRMTPPPESKNLENFKNEFSKYKKYLFLPVFKEGKDYLPLFELGIVKNNINILSADMLQEKDIEYIVLKKEEGISGYDAGVLDAMPADTKKFNPERIGEALAIFETEISIGSNKKKYDPMIIDSLAAVSYDENGLIVLESVNPLLIVAAEEVRREVIEREAGKVPLIEVQKQYIEFLENYFENPYREMQDNDLAPHQMAELMTIDDKYVSAWKSAAPEMFDYLRECWGPSGLVAVSNLRRTPTLKAVYGGNTFPHPQSNLGYL